MAASSRVNSNTVLKKIDETRGKISLEISEIGDFSVNETISDWQTHTHHINLSIFCEMKLSSW